MARRSSPPSRRSSTSTTSQPDIQLTLTIVDNTEPSDTLATQIATGNAPDIIGPVGIRGLQPFGDQLPISRRTSAPGVDLSEIPPELIDAFKVDGKQIGLPTGVYPSFIYYNKKLFDEAGLAYPPHKVGDSTTASRGPGPRWRSSPRS